MCDSPHVNPCGIPQLKVGRDAHGRFRPGNQGGPGNPFARKVAALRKTLLDCVSDQDLKDMVEALKLKARQGDTSAIKLLLQYCVGKPESPRDPDRMDADEWRRLQEMRVGEREFWETIRDVPACLACHRAETYWPCDVQDGPWAEEVHYVRSQLQAGDPFAEVRFHSQVTTQPDAAPAQPGAASANHAEESNAPSEPTPTAQRPSPAMPTSKSNGRREPAGPSGRNGRSLTQPPSPNGGIKEQPRQALGQPQRLRQPPRPSGQAQRKPPRG